MACPVMDRGAAAGSLASGGVVILATDTLPGLHARADLPAAVARVRVLKGRDGTQPLLVLADSLDSVRPLLSALSSAQEDVCARCWPGPFTLILPAAGGDGGLPAPATGTLAVRVPGHSELRRLIAAAGFPLVSTSANDSGRPPCTSLEEAVREFGDRVDGCWPADAGGPEAAVPSCLVDLTGPAPQILRRGPVPFPGGGGEES